MTGSTIYIEGIAYYTDFQQPSNGAINAPIVLLCHALMSNNNMWDDTVDALTNAGYSALRYDHIGHNKTPAPANHNSTMEAPAYHFDDLTRHMHELVRAVTGQSKVHAVIGCSMGGVLALRFAMLYPSDVRLALSCDAPGMTSLEASKLLWTQRIEQLAKDVESGDDVLARATVDRWFPGDDLETVRVRERSLTQVGTCSLDGYRICADGIRTYDYLDQLDGIRDVGCMVLVGSEDGAVGPRSVLQDVARRIPGAEYVWQVGAGHLPPMHRPTEFNRIMLGFLSKQ